MSLHPNAKRCTHIKVTGHQCGSPALRGEHFCYFHTRMIKGVRSRPDQRLAASCYIVDSPEALQVALIETLNDIVRGNLDPRRASLVLRALAIAQKNMRYAHFHQHARQMVRDLPDYDQQYLLEYEAEQKRAAAARQKSQTPAAPQPPADEKAAPPAQAGTQHTEACRKPPQKAAVTTPANEAESLVGDAPPPGSTPSQQREWHKLKRLEQSIPKAITGDVRSARKLFDFVGLTRPKTKGKL